MASVLRLPFLGSSRFPHTWWSPQGACRFLHTAGLACLLLAPGTLVSSPVVAACPQLTWSTPAPLFTPQTGRAVRGFDLIETSDQRLVAVWGWSDGPAAPASLYWSVSSATEPGGWSLPRRVDPSSTTLVEGGPLLALAGDGTLVLTFWRSTEATAAPATRWLSRLSAQGDTWESPLLLAGVPASRNSVGLVAVSPDSLWVFSVDTTGLRGWPVVGGQVGTPIFEPATDPWTFDDTENLRAARTHGGAVLVWWTAWPGDSWWGNVEFTWLVAGAFEPAPRRVNIYGGPIGGEFIEDRSGKLLLALDYPTDIYPDASVLVVHWLGSAWSEPEFLAGGEGPEQPSTSCLGARIALLDTGKPVVVYGCDFFPFTEPVVRLYASAFGGTAWCPPQPLWMTPVEMAHHPATDLVTRQGALPLLAYTTWDAQHQLLVTEVVASVGIAPAPPEVPVAESDQFEQTDLVVRYVGPREMEFCGGPGVAGLHIELFDVAGRRVVTLPEPGESAQTCIPWRALDSDGRAVAAGTYLFRAYERGEPRRAIAAGKVAVWAR